MRLAEFISKLELLPHYATVQRIDGEIWVCISLTRWVKLNDILVAKADEV